MIAFIQAPAPSVKRGRGSRGRASGRQPGAPKRARAPGHDHLRRHPQADKESSEEGNSSAAEQVGYSEEEGSASDEPTPKKTKKEAGERGIKREHGAVAGGKASASDAGKRKSKRQCAMCFKTDKDLAAF